MVGRIQTLKTRILMNNNIATLDTFDWQSLSDGEIDAILEERIIAYESAIALRGGKRPKREGFVVERIASMENLRKADKEAQKRKSKREITVNGKKTRVPNKWIRKHNKNAENELRQLQRMILTLKFPPLNYRKENIKTDAGKIRELIKQNYYPWRILQHAIMLVVGPRIFKSLITDTCACIKGKGLHFGVQRVRMTLRRHPEYKWFWKTDFKKYYQSLPHQLVREAFGKLFKDKMFLTLLDMVILAYDSGEELIQTLNDEVIRNQRHPYWGGLKPDRRQSCDEQDRPSDEAQRQEDSLLPILRRCNGARTHESGGDKGNEEILSVCDGGGHRGKGECVCLPDRR